MRCMVALFCHIRGVTRVAAKPTHALKRAQAARRPRDCERAHVRAHAASVELPAVEEFFLHLWDELDDVTGICRHVATTMVAEAVAVSAPVIAATSGALLAGAATLLLSQHEFPGVLA